MGQSIRQWFPAPSGAISGLNWNMFPTLDTLTGSFPRMSQVMMSISWQDLDSSIPEPHISGEAYFPLT